MQKKDFPTAVDFYTKALALVPLNPIYLSNRAAAYSGAGKHEEAVNDAEMATAADPKFAKAWSRLGYAKYALGDAKGSMEAYREGIEAEGNGGSDVMRKGLETARRKIVEEGGNPDEDEEEVASRGVGGGGMPDLASMASMFGGGGAGGAGGGGLPNFSEMMNNPMMASMANKLMSNPDLMSNLLSNPRLKDMFGGGAGGAGRGGGMPDMSSLMSDPSIQEL
jgi:small glutamine-rich tetratricopeptide repeat-containing protein alpha